MEPKHYCTKCRWVSEVAGGCPRCGRMLIEDRRKQKERRQ